MTVEIIITAEKPDRAQAAGPQAGDALAAPAPGTFSLGATHDGVLRQGPLSALERAAFFAALRRKAEARLAALG